MPPAGEGRPPSEAESEDAKRFFTLATQARQTEDFAAAIDLYTQGLETARTVELRSALLLNRSLTRSSKQQWKNALADANECLSLRPSWSRSYECLAVCLQGLGREEESILSKRLAAGLAALKLNPKNENMKKQVRDIRKELAIAHDRGRAKNPQASTETVPVQAEDEAARPPEPGSTLQADAPSPRAATAADGHSSGSISSRPTDSEVANPFEPGCRVRVQGLIAASQYNGLLGTLRGTDGSRYVVHLDKGGELHVQAKHFTVVISSPATVPASKLPGDHVTMATSPLSMARDDPGPFRGHPPAGVSQASNVSTAWVAANKISADGDIGKAGLHAVLACIRGQFIFENMGREGQLWRHGVRRNDRLLAVNDRRVDDMNLHDVHALIEGNEGSRLCLTLQKSDDQGGSPTPWKITLMRTSSYVIDCLVAAHQELLGILKYHNDLTTLNNGGAMQYSSAVVTDLHQRLTAGMQTLKRDQRQLLQDKAQMRCELEEYERRCNTSWADGRRADDENRRMYQELEEREKMMQMMASDFDDIMSDSRERFVAVTITLDQPFETTSNTYSTAIGSVTFEEMFRADLAQILQTDDDRVAVLGMSKGSVVLDTVLLPPEIGSTDTRPAWQLKSALKAMVSDNTSVLYHSSKITAKTVAVTDMPEAKVLQDAQARCVRLGHENAVLAHERDMLVGENHQLGLKIDKLEKRSQELESTSREAQETIFVLRNEISVIRNQLSHDTSINDRDVRLRELTELLESREKQIAHMNQSLSTRVALLQKSEASERQRCTEAEERARDIEGELRRANKTIAALEGQLAASNGIRETMESKYRKMDQTMQQLQDTDGDLRRQLRALQDENHHLERLSAQLRASAVSVSANSSADAELYAKEVRKLQRQMLEDMVSKPKHESMKAACASELKEMAVKLEEYQQRVADVTTALALHAKVLVEGEFSGEARAEMQAQIALDQQHAAALEDELKSKSDEASELKHQLRELAKKAPLTEPDVKKMLDESLSQLDAQAREIKSLRLHRAQDKANLDVYRTEHTSALRDIHRLLRIEIEEGDGGILQRIVAQQRTEDSQEKGARGSLPVLHSSRVSNSLVATAIRASRDPVDVIWIRGLEEQAASLRNRVASLEQGVIVGWMLQNSEKKTGLGMESPISDASPLRHHLKQACAKFVSAPQSAFTSTEPGGLVPIYPDSEYQG